MSELSEENENTIKKIKPGEEGVKIMKFRKKPIVVDAIQFTGNNCFEILHFMNRSSDIIDAEVNNTDCPTINTLEGDLQTTPGDWIIKGVKGEFYPCKTDIFELSYERKTDIFELSYERVCQLHDKTVKK